MPKDAARAFVLGSSILNEQDKLVHLLTLEKGILKAIAPGACKFKNRFGALLELFTEGEFFYYWSEGKELITISRGDIINSYFHIVSTAGSIFYFYLVSEIILKFIPPAHKSERVFKLVHATLEQRKGGVDMDRLLLYFLVWMLRIEGMMFNPDTCYNCFAQNIKSAWLKTNFRGILCRQCRTNEKHELEYGELKFIKWTEKHAPADLPLWQETMDIQKMIRVFTKKIEHHGECRLKSSQYLPEFK